MAYSIATLDHYKQHKDIADALSEFDTPFDFGDDVSLATYIADNETAKVKLKNRNESWKKFLADDAEFQAAEAAVDIKNAKIRHCLIGTKGENSDEYVAAGGIRRSDITAQAQATRAENKKNPPPPKEKKS